eukprot:TRINITY_DN322_c0_g2_i1.p1 TRINITY_DN322_c0_g2~~TRINITY_DN322_c0_g2_i1.p1  ORF type:complete len:1811 (+),score=378.79 TRINITY_DN322_c0_g2_i1:232-5664(+)
MPSTVLYWDGLLATDSFASTDWSGKSGLLKEKVKVAVEQLLLGEYKSAGLDLKRCGAQRGEYPLYTVKLSRDDRLLFTTLARGKNSQLLLLECIENHDYQKARFMKYGVLKTYMEKEAAWEPVDSPVVAPVKEASFSLAKVRPALGGFVTFTDLQESILKLDAPLLMLGAAGTGKTCIAQALLSDACGRGCSKMLYVAKSAELVETVAETLAVDADATVHVRTYSQLAQSTLREVGIDALCEWLAEDSVGQKALKNLSSPDDDFALTCGRVYEEFRIFSGGAAEHAALGVRQKVLPAGKSAFVSEAYRQYQAYLSESRMTDLSFLEHCFETEYDLVVVDEGQDFSRLQLKQLCSAAKDSRVVFCMDPQQSVHDALSSKDYIATLCGDIQVVSLPETFRTPLAVIPVVNRLLSLRREMVGGVVHKDEYLEVLPSKYTTENMDSGEVHWVSPNDTRSMRDLRAACGRCAVFAVVVGSSECVAHAIDVFDTPLVFTAEQAKGLEYAHLVVFNPFPEDDPLLRKADKRCPVTLTPSTKRNRTKDKTSTHDLAYATPFNKLFVAFTRTSHALYVVQDTDVHKNLVRCVKGEASTAPSVMLSDIAVSPLSDWEDEVQRQAKRGNDGVARCIQQRQIDPEHCRLEGNAHFKRGDYQLAADSYRASLDGRKTAAVYCNLAAAHLKLSNLNESIDSCKRAIELDPTFGKSYFRLAKALGEKNDDPAALLQASVIAKAMFQNDREVESVVRKVLGSKKVIVVAKQKELDRCAPYMTSDYFVVLMPGEYRAPLMPMRGNLVGVANPSLVGHRDVDSHVILCGGDNNEILVAGVTFKNFADARFALLLCNDYSELHMLGCTIRGSSDNGVLCCGNITVTDCQFHDIANSGIEFREGGGGTVVGCTITHCRQGISAYGGFDTVTISKSTISDCECEGLMLHGTATTPGDREFFGSRGTCPIALNAFHNGSNTGAVSKVVVSRCNVLRNKGLGLSLDTGIIASVLKTRISDNGSKGLTPPAAKVPKGMKKIKHTGMFKCGVLVKGNSKVLVHTCAFSKNGESGVRVCVNYDAPVTVQNCTFAEESKTVIEEATSGLMGNQQHLPTKMYSVPVNKAANNIVSYARQLPDVTEMDEAVDPVHDITHSTQNHKRAPEPEFHPLVKPTHNFVEDPYYAMGTTKGIQVVGRPAEAGGAWCNVLLGACGDIRNVLSSMASEHTEEGRFHFVLNDNQPAILARDLVLLNIIVTQTDSKYCLSVWGDHFLTEKCTQVVSDVITQLLEGSAPVCGDMDDATKAAVFAVLEVWKAIKPAPSDMHREQNVRDQAVALSVEASTGIEYRVVQQYFQSGFLNTGSKLQGHFAKTPNVTLFPHGTQYSMYPTCSIFRAVPSPSIAALQRTVEAQCKSLRDAFNEKRFKVTAVCMDLLSYFSSTDTKFTFADVSNLIDYSSLPAVFILLRQVMHPRASVTFQNCLETPESLRLQHPDDRAWCALTGIHGMTETGSQGHIKFMSAELRRCGLNPYSGLVECLELAKRFDFSRQRKKKTAQCSNASVNVLLAMLQWSCGGDAALFASVARLFVQHSSVQKYRPQLECYLGILTAQPSPVEVIHLILNINNVDSLSRNAPVVAVLTQAPLKKDVVDVDNAVHVFDSFTLDSFSGRLSLKMQRSDILALRSLYVTVCLVPAKGTAMLLLKEAVTRLSESAKLSEFYCSGEDELWDETVQSRNAAPVDVPDAWGTVAEMVGEEFVSVALSVPAGAGDGKITARCTSHEVVVYQTVQCLKGADDLLEVYRFASSTALVPSGYEVRRDVDLRMLSLLLERAPASVP